MRSEGKKRTLELSLIQGFSKIEKLFGGATRNRTRDTKGNSNLKKMGFLWLFHKSLKKATEFNISLHILMPSGFDETIECNTSKNKSDETRNNEHSVFRA